MSDTTIIIKQTISDSLMLDSINQKLIVLQHASARTLNNPSFTIWIPLISSIIGGSLVLIGQAIERNRRKNIDKKNNLLEIYATCRKIEAEMKNNYRELAMAKSHVEYWWHCCNSSSSALSDKPRYYEEHLRSQSYAREIERNIGTKKAEFIGYVRKFQAIHSTKNDFENDIDSISNLTNPKAKSYSFNIPHETLRNEIYDKDENELREVYYKNLTPFKNINNTLLLSISKKTKKAEV